jgi:hypothetical protein
MTYLCLVEAHRARDVVSHAEGSEYGHYHVHGDGGLVLEGTVLLCKALLRRPEVAVCSGLALSQ